MLFEKFLGFLNPSFKKGLSGVQGQSPWPITPNLPHILQEPPAAGRGLFLRAKSRHSVRRMERISMLSPAKADLKKSNRMMFNCPFQ